MLICSWNMMTTQLPKPTLGYRVMVVSFTFLVFMFSGLIGGGLGLTFGRSDYAVLPSTLPSMVDIVTYFDNINFTFELVWAFSGYIVLAIAGFLWKFNGNVLAAVRYVFIPELWIGLILITIHSFFVALAFPVHREGLVLPTFAAGVAVVMMLKYIQRKKTQSGALTWKQYIFNFAHLTNFVVSSIVRIVIGVVICLAVSLVIGELVDMGKHRTEVVANHLIGKPTQVYGMLHTTFHPTYT